MPSSEPTTRSKLEAVQAKLQARKQRGGFEQLHSQGRPTIDAAFRDVEAAGTPAVAAGAQGGREARRDTAAHATPPAWSPSSVDQASSRHKGPAATSRASEGPPEATEGSPEADGNSLAEEEEEQMDPAAIKVRCLINCTTAGPEYAEHVPRATF